MLYALALILIIAWLLGVVSNYTLGGVPSHPADHRHRHAAGAANPR
jgi:hypothetical protein